MIAVIIIEYRNPVRTVRYIEDFIKASDYSDVFFVIVDNSPEMTNCENIKALLKDSGYEMSVYTLNSKLDGQTICYSKENTMIFYYSDCQNHGFAMGNNIGVNIAKEVKAPDLYLFSNSDIQFHKELRLSCLIRTLYSDSNNALVGPRVIGLDGVPQSPCRYVNIWKRHIIPNILWPINKVIKPIKSMNYDTIEDAASGEAYRVIGAFMLAKADKFESVGGFDSTTFLYAEEAILTEKFKRRNYKVIYDNDVEIIHEQGGSTSEKDKSHGQNIIAKRIRLFESEMYYYSHYIKCHKTTIALAKVSFAIYKWKLMKYYHI